MLAGLLGPKEASRTSRSKCSQCCSQCCSRCYSCGYSRLLFPVLNPVLNPVLFPLLFPVFQALLTEGGEFSCGAVVLSPRWLLTAAHCVWGKPAAVFNVTVGEHDLAVEERTEQRRAVVEVLVHPGYNRSSYDNDVALLRLQRPVRLGDYVVPVCLPARNSTFSRTLNSVHESTVSGWGRLAQFGATPQVLQRASLPRVSQQDCRLHARLNITGNMLCAGLRAGGRDACKGDSGGPLVTLYRTTWFLTGVVSWGKDCAKENLYGVYAKVSRFVDWIQDAMSSD